MGDKGLAAGGQEITVLDSRSGSKYAVQFGACGAGGRAQYGRHGPAGVARADEKWSRGAQHIKIAKQLLPPAGGVQAWNVGERRT